MKVVLKDSDLEKILSKHDDVDQNPKPEVSAPGRETRTDTAHPKEEILIVYNPAGKNWWVVEVIIKKIILKTVIKKDAEAAYAREKLRQQDQKEKQNSARDPKKDDAEQGSPSVYPSRKS